MNRIDELKMCILKMLLFERVRSVYSLEKKLKERFTEQGVNYPTLLRHVNRLKEEGLIGEEKGKRKNGKLDMRKTRRLASTTKGIFYLILKTDLEDNEIRIAADRIFHILKFKPEFYRKVTQVEISLVERLIKKIRPRVNLEYFDNEYVENLFVEAWMEAIYEKLIPEEFERHLGMLRNNKTSIKEAIKTSMSFGATETGVDFRNIPDELLQCMKEWLEYFKTRRKSITQKIDFLEPILEVLSEAKAVKHQ